MTLRAQIEELLKGIDEEECESDNGWWETSTGAAFGAGIKAKLLALIDAQLPWTTDKPTKAGWYWYRACSDQYTEDKPQMVDVGEDGATVTFGNGWERLMQLVSPGLWAGPLEVPNEEGDA